MTWPARQRRRAGSAVALVVLAGLTLGALGHVAVQAKRLEVGLCIGEAERLHRELSEQRRKLLVEIGRLKDPARIVALARELVMASPEPAAIRPVRWASPADASRREAGGVTQP